MAGALSFAVPQFELSELVHALWRSWPSSFSTMMQSCARSCLFRPSSAATVIASAPTHNRGAPTVGRGAASRPASAFSSSGHAAANAYDRVVPTTDIRDLCTAPSSFRPVRFLIDNVAANHCHQCTDVADSNLFHSQRVGTQHCEIGESAGLKGAFLSFVEA